jgi:hypothetical protein
MSSPLNCASRANMFHISLSKKQRGKLSDIFGNLGLLSASSIIVPVVLENFNFYILSAGALVSITFWILSLWLLK